MTVNTYIYYTIHKYNAHYRFPLDGDPAICTSDD